VNGGCEGGSDGRLDGGVFQGIPQVASPGPEGSDGLEGRVYVGKCTGTTWFDSKALR